MTGPRYWRSLDELAETPGFKAAVEKEFPEGASSMDGVDRRQFMKIMAASFALGGASGSRAAAGPRSTSFPSASRSRAPSPAFPSTLRPRCRCAAGRSRSSRRPTRAARPSSRATRPTLPHGGGARSSPRPRSSTSTTRTARPPTRRTAKKIDAAAVKEAPGRDRRKYKATQGAGLAFLADCSSSPTRPGSVRNCGPVPEGHLGRVRARDGRAAGMAVARRSSAPT
jgi:MoCo/4Fe-4S cofactor protein with predicted Tat translocation signal